jgi:membrane protein implicated in regulation of membrane protease activity
MSTNKANQLLRSAYVFTCADFEANREGRLSERQVASLRAGRFGARIAAALFVVVMLGTVALIVASSMKSKLDVSTSMLVVLTMAVIALIAGSLFLSLKYVKTLHSRSVHIAIGCATNFIADVDRNVFRVKVGDTTLRVSSVEQLNAFLPHIEYQVHYLPGAMPLILSAATTNVATSVCGSATTVNKDEVHPHALKRGVLIAILIATLALAIPAFAIFSDVVPREVRRWVWAALVVLSIVPIVVMLWSRWFPRRD